MADKKGEAPSDGAGGLTKMEGVRRAQAALGKGAKPLAIQKYVKDELGLDVSTAVISTYKREIARKAKKGAKPKAQPAPEATAAARQTTTDRPEAPRQAGAAGIPLHDILAVKELVGRLGAGPLHTLIDVFAR
jgi:hypothetical protein